MSTSTATVTRNRAGGGLGSGVAGRTQVAGQEDSDSDSTPSGARDRYPRNQGAAGGQGPAVEEQAATNPASGGLEETSVPDGKEIHKMLKDVIMEIRPSLQNMYGKTEAELNKSLEVLVGKGEEMARKLIRDMGCTREVAKELTVLTLYDVAILIDDSDSMIYEEGGKRKKTLVQYVDNITEIYSMAKGSGILAMRFMNGPKGKRNWTGKSQEYLDQHKYGGVTRIGTELKEKILDIFATRNEKQTRPLLVLIVTDGTVEGEKRGRLKKVIRDCVNEREEAGKGFDAVSFQFSRIGNDPGAAQLLIELDEDRDLGKYIDVLPVEFDMESQLADKWFMLPKILLGAILPTWDKQDDYNLTQQEDHLAKMEDDKEVEEDDWEE
ncbi:hypothetical protein HOY80DRAFT_902534 [Tuber brumale]|nr:hypothetical protein HOY80DRAFT_902534 [Tuber brumale]